MNGINQFVSADTALNLKELGFDFEVIGYYDAEENYKFHYSASGPADWNNSTDTKISAPNLYEASFWLLKNNNVYIEVFPESGASYVQDKYVYDFIIWIGPRSYHELKSLQCDDIYNSPWFCLQEGIEEAIRILNGTSTLKSDFDVLEDAGVLEEFKKWNDEIECGGRPLLIH